MEKEAERHNLQTLRYSQRALPPLELLQRLFAYDPETGLVTEKTRRAPRTKIGAPAGGKDAQHYLRTKIATADGVITAAIHRIAFALGTGCLPPETHIVDHINRVRDDNRLANLRLLTPAENALNKSHRAGRALPKGVTRAGKRYVARINFDATGEKTIGMFLTRDEAARSYDAAARQFGGPLVRTNEDLGLLPHRSDVWWSVLESVRDWDRQKEDFEGLIERLEQLILKEKR